MITYSHCFVTLTLAVAGFCGLASASTTVEGLQAALEFESNARVRYLAFAENAAREDYGELASLFRAVAKAEEIHASRLAAALQKMGVAPQVKHESPMPQSTRQNLEFAVNSEWRELDTSYPESIKQARAEGNNAAVEAFNFAKAGEREHLRLLTDALNTLSRFKGTKPTVYEVCIVCGHIVPDTSGSKCPFCASGKDRREKVI